MKISLIFYWYSKTKQSNLFQNVFRTTIVLGGMWNNFCLHFPWKKVKNTICWQIKTQNIYCINLTIRLNLIECWKIKIRHSSKVKDDIGLIKIEEKDNQFLIEKIIDRVEKNNPFVISMEKTLKFVVKSKRTIGYVDVSTNPCLFSIYIHLNLTNSNNLMTI